MGRIPCSRVTGRSLESFAALLFTVVVVATAAKDYLRVRTTMTSPETSDPVEK